jgi:hypothetical protein
MNEIIEELVRQIAALEKRLEYLETVEKNAFSTVAVADYLTALGGVHVGGTSDPGTDNLLVDGKADIVDFLAAYGGINCGGTSDPGTDNLLVAGNAQVTDYLTADGGVHVGGTSDPGADNLLVDGTADITGVLTAKQATFGDKDVPNRTIINASVLLRERASCPDDSATHGQIWVKNTDPNELWYTDGEGTETQLA